MSTNSLTAPQNLVGKDFFDFLERYRSTLQSVFGSRAETVRMHLTRGMPPSMLREILAARPLSVFIPETYGGRGERVSECLSVLEASAYESLALSLTVGINGALFLQPVSKYGREEVKTAIFERFLNHQNMGGLMMTEPGHGSDALNMVTSYTPEDGGYRIRGVKHWAGLTGLADFWLMTARARNEGGGLSRDIDFFVCDVHRPEQAIRVEERYENLGLLLIPYGRNTVDVLVPEAHRLVPKRTGLTMMLDVLHRSRIQFPGMGIGFLRRMLDEAVRHCQDRQVGGKSLISYDQVQQRLARLQASVTASTAMCAYTAEHAALARDLSKESVPANAIKAVITDLMHEAAHSLLQLVGAKGYRLDHIAGRSVVDSRPFQIFEGSNDILYEQIAEAILKQMRREKEQNLRSFLRGFKLGSRASHVVGSAADVEIDASLPQRKVVDLGKVLGRIITMEFVIELGERGYRDDLVNSCLELLRQDVHGLLIKFGDRAECALIDEGFPGEHWLGFVRNAGVR